MILFGTEMFKVSTTSLPFSYIRATMSTAHKSGGRIESLAMSSWVMNYCPSHVQRLLLFSSH